MRKANFMFIEAEIVRLNSSQKYSTHAHNWMSDFTREEYNRLQGLKDVPPPDLSKFPTYKGSGANQMPMDLNWCATSGTCEPIYNQGLCGSCYAFAATAAMASNMVIKENE